MLYDAVALLAPEAAVAELLEEPAARDFVSDAFVHGKFIAFAPSAMPLLSATIGETHVDEGCIEVTAPGDIKNFVKSCRTLRFWQRAIHT